MAENQTLAVTVQHSGGIDLYNRIANPLDAIERAGTFFAKSGMFGCEKIEQGMVLAMECLATHKPPSVIARTYHIMDGKLSKKALAALAEFRSIGGKHKWLKDGNDGKEASLELTLEGNTIVSTFSMDDAKRIGASFKPGSGWVKAPGNMLRARCISNGVAMLAPEIFAGDVEEDYGTPARTAEPLLPETKPVTVVTEAPAAGPEIKKRAAETEKRRDEVIDVKSEPAVEDQIPGAEVPAKPAATAAEPFTAEAKADGTLTAATQGALAAHIGEENIDAFYKWNVAQNRLKADQTIGNLSVKFANTTLRMPRERILAAIKGVK